MATQHRHPSGRRAASLAVLGLLMAGAVSNCRYDRADRWDDRPATVAQSCTPGELRCAGTLQTCQTTSTGGSAWVVTEDCGQKNLVCASRLQRCTACQPDDRQCNGQDVMACAADGSAYALAETCQPGSGTLCRTGSCADLCQEAAKNKSNVGCEYWSADLDNAFLGATSNAAGQQFAIVVSNPQPDAPAHVVIEQNDAPLGSPPAVSVVAEADIPPNNLRVFKLGPREVDGSPPDTFDQGMGTALTPNAFRLRSHLPVVAYQFNPLDNVAVFSNDASLLKPTESVTYTPGLLEPAYVVLGWPQTIAHTDDPDTNFDPSYPINLRAFVTVVGTRPDTRLRFTTAVRVIPGEGLPEMQPGDVRELTLQPFDVLNLETGGFNADFTGSLIEADQPVMVFSGSEASDAPFFQKLSERFCCADHLEEQLDPIRTAGTRFIAAHAPNRSQAVFRAGATLSGVVDEPEYFRILAVSAQGPTQVTTTLPPPDDSFSLQARGAWRDIRATRDFMAQSNLPVTLASVQASQDAAGVMRGLPGGDPSLIIIPPVEQYRPDYVFLTPDKYSFDFISIMAPPDAIVLIDGTSVADFGCEKAAADGLTEQQRGSPTPPAVVYRCQFSFPIVDATKTAPNNVQAGIQNDGVHRVQSDRDVMVLVYGFDNYVSYGYAAGTRLEALSVR